MDKYFKDAKLSLFNRIYKEGYYMFTRKEIDELFNNCYEFILDEINKLL